MKPRCDFNKPKQNAIKPKICISTQVQIHTRLFSNHFHVIQSSVETLQAASRKKSGTKLNQPPPPPRRTEPGGWGEGARKRG